MNSIDDIIENVMQKQIYEPDGFEKSILTAFDSNKQHKNIRITFTKMISAICLCIIITTGVVFAKEISNWIYEIFNPASTGTGVINMAENGYLYNTQMEYVGKNENLIKIEYIMMDDYNLNIVFNLKLKEKIDELYEMEMKNLIIVDENKNLIFCSNNNDVYKQYCRENNLKYDENWNQKNYTNGGYQTEILEKNDDNIRFIYKMYSSGYPKSKELLMRIEDIEITPTIKSIKLNEKNIIKGKWNLNIKLPPEFYNREIINYNVEDEKNKEYGINVEEAVASYTEMHISLKIKNASNAINGSKEEVENRIIEILNRDENDEIVKSPIIENQKGKIFEISTAAKQGNFMKVYKKNGDMDVYMIFPITKYDCTEKLKLKMNFKGEDICINLIR